MTTPMTNHALLIGHRGLRDAQSIITQAAERLATGKRINRAADDPSGLIAADELSQQMAWIEGKLKGLDQREAVLGATEGALSVVGELLHELDGIVVQAANTGGLSEDELGALQSSADELIAAIDLIANTATFKGDKLFSSLFSTSRGRVTARAETDGDDATQESVQAFLGAIRSGGALNLIDGDIEAAQQSVQSAIDGISARRAGIGAEIRHDIAAQRSTLLQELEQNAAAKSLIVDADLAAETASLMRGQILQQASISAILFARQNQSAALQLLSAATR